MKGYYKLVAAQLRSNGFILFPKVARRIKYGQTVKDL